MHLYVSSITVAQSGEATRVPVLPQSQMPYCRRTTIFFSGDCDNIARGPHGNRPAAIQFEWWQFIFETPLGAFSWLRKKLQLDGDRAIFESLLTHSPGSVRTLCGDRTMLSENERRPDDFYENVHLKIVRLPNYLRLASRLPPFRRLTEPGRAPLDCESYSEHRPMTVRSPDGIDFVHSFRTVTGRQLYTVAT